VQYNKPLVSGLVLATIMAMIGCGQNTSQNQPAASINGENDASAKAKGHKSAQSDFDLMHPQVLIETSLGKIVVELDKEKSPLTVNNFLDYVDTHSYDKTIFHQVYKNQAVIAGGYTTDLAEIPHRIPVSNEAHNGLKNLRGTIAMLRQSDITVSATSKFFINVVNNPALDFRSRDPADPEEYGYCVFGQVVEGMEVADRIANTPVEDTDKFDQTPVQAVIIKSISRVK